MINDASTSDTKDQFNATRVMGQLRAHDAAVEEIRGEMALHKATYATNFWMYGRGAGNQKTWGYGKSTGVDIEVNELQPMIRARIAAIFRATQRVSCNPDPMGRGDPEKMALVYNAWLTQRLQKPRILRALTQLELYPGVGFKVVTVSGTAPAIERVQLRIVPWWEVVLDRDVTDEEEERFRGHIYWMPRIEAEAKWPMTRGKLKGTTRSDFLANPSGTSASRSAGKRNRGNAPGTTSSDVSQDDDWVRVLEFYNLRDNVTKDGSTFVGRLEVWMVDQDDEFRREPIIMEPLPFATPSGRPLPPIVPCIQLPEGEYPFRGIAPVKRAMPQYAEQNLCRSAIAAASRLNARKGLVRPGALGTNAKDVLSDGVDMHYGEVAADYQGPLSDAIYNVPHHPVASDLYKWQEILGADKSAVRATPPQSLGQIAGRDTTAYEVQTAALAMENETGMSAGVFLAAMTDVLILVGRGVILNMTRVKDSSGGNAGDVDLASHTAKPAAGQDSPEQNEVDATNTAAAEARGGVDPLRSLQSMLMPGTDVNASGHVEIVQDILQVQDEKGTTPVTAADLDGDFPPTFVEGVRTPMTDAAKQQALLSVYPQYAQLWQQVNEGGPAGILAEQAMRSIAVSFDLPESMHVDALKAALHREEKETPPPASSPMKRAAQPPPGEEPMPPPPDEQAAHESEPSAPANRPGGEKALTDAEAAVKAGDVDTALRVLNAAFGDRPAAKKILDEIAATDDPAQRLALINDTLTTIRSALSGGAP